VCILAQHLFVMLCQFICRYVHKNWQLPNTLSWNYWLFLWKAVKPLQYCLSDNLIITLCGSVVIWKVHCKSED